MKIPTTVVNRIEIRSQRRDGIWDSKASGYTLPELLGTGTSTICVDISKSKFRFQIMLESTKMTVFVLLSFVSDSSLIRRI